MPEAYKRCVRSVSRKKGTKRAHAICTASNAGNIKKVRKLESKARKRVLGNG